MKYTGKTIPEEINVPKSSPLREFVVLSVGLIGLIIVAMAILFVFADYFVQFIGRDSERKLFKPLYPTAVTRLLKSEKTPAADKDKQRVDAYLMSIVTRLQKHWNGDKQQFSIVVVRSEVPNAFVLPGGHIGVTTGLLKSISSENALAMVIGHEMGHQYKRHPLKRMGRLLSISLMYAVVSGNDSSISLDTLMSSTLTVTILKYGRDQEKEADAVGKQLMTKHYGHARGAAEFFERMIKLKKTSSNLPEFLQTHPKVESRIEFLRHAKADTPKKLVPLPEFVVAYANKSD